MRPLPSLTAAATFRTSGDPAIDGEVRCAAGVSSASAKGITVTVFLWIVLALALLSALSVTVSTMSGPSGPEGPVGAGVIVVFSCVFVAILVFVLSARGMMGPLPGGRLVQFVAAVGIVITFSASLVETLDRHDGLAQTLLTAIPYLLLAGCATLIHPADLSYPPASIWAMAILLEGAAIAGWGIGAKRIARFLRKQQEKLDQLVREEPERDEQRKQEEMTRYEELGDAVPLFKLLPFTCSRNDRIQLLARERVAALPGLDESLVALLDLDSEDAVRYIARAYETPPKDLVPAYGRILERLLKSWDSLQYDEHPRTWELNLKGYFEGAQKIRRAGGDLRPQLRLWHQFLLTCRGLDNLAAFVETLL